MTTKKGGKKTSSKSKSAGKAQRTARRAPASEDTLPEPEPVAPESAEADPSPMPEADDEWHDVPKPSPESPPEPEPVASTPIPEPPPAPEPSPPPAQPTEPPAAAPAQRPTPRPAPAPGRAWTPAATKPAATKTAAEDDLWIRIATARRGLPSVAITGWVLTWLGLALMAETYYWGYLNGVLYQPAGVLGYYWGAILLVIGLGLAIAFAFIPSRRAFGLGLDAKPADLQEAAQKAHVAVRRDQILVGAGVTLILLGLVWVLYWLRIAFLNSALRDSQIGNYLVPTHLIGVLLVAIGLGITLYFAGQISAARRSRNLAVIGLITALRGGSGGPGKRALASGVSESEIQNLMKRLDSLMAQLPDDAVSEFSRTGEADTYLKLLGS